MTAPVDQWIGAVCAARGEYRLPVRATLLAGSFVADALGLLFGSSIKRSGDVTVDYGANLLGAMVGGVAEYLSLVTGFQFLLILVAIFYVAALATRKPA